MWKRNLQLNIRIHTNTTANTKTYTAGSLEAPRRHVNKVIHIRWQIIRFNSLFFGGEQPILKPSDVTGCRTWCQHVNLLAVWTHTHTYTHLRPRPSVWQHVVMQSGVCLSSWQTCTDSMVRALQTREKNTAFITLQTTTTNSLPGTSSAALRTIIPVFQPSDAVSLWWLSNACFCVSQTARKSGGECIGNILICSRGNLLTRGKLKQVGQIKTNLGNHCNITCI